MPRPKSKRQINTPARLSDAANVTGHQSSKRQRNNAPAGNVYVDSCSTSSTSRPHNVNNYNNRPNVSCVEGNADVRSAETMAGSEVQVDMCQNQVTSDTSSPVPPGLSLPLHGSVSSFSNQPQPIPSHSVRHACSFKKTI